MAKLHTTAQVWRSATMSAEADTDTYSDGETDSVTVDDGEGDTVNVYDTLMLRNALCVATEASR